MPLLLDRPDQPQPQQESFAERRRKREQEADNQTFVQSFLEAGGDVLGDIGTGVVEFPQALAGGVEDAARALKKLAVEGLSAHARHKGFQRAAPIIEATPDVPEIFDEPESVTGQLTRNITQFMVGFGPFRKALGVAQATTTAGKIGLSTLAGAMTDFALFEGQEKKLADIVAQVPGLGGLVPQFMQSQEDDTEIIGRIKSTLQNAALGAVAEVFVEGLKLLRAARKVKLVKENAKIEKKLREVGPGGPETVKADGPLPGSVDVGADEFAGNIRLSKYTGPQEIRDELKNAAKANDEFMAVRGVVPDADIERMALMKDMQLEETVKFQEFFKGKLASEVVATRQLLHTSGVDAVNKAKLAMDGGDEALKDFAESYTRLVAVQEQVSGITAEAGRLLRSFRIEVGDNLKAKALRQIIDSHGGRDDILDLAAKFSAVGDPAQAAKLARESWGARFSDALMELWINMLLSGPQTHATNILSNTATAVWTIPERGLTATMGAVLRNPERASFKEPMAMAVGLVQGAKDGMKLAAKAYRTEIPTDQLTKIEARRWQAIPSGKLDTLAKKVFGQDASIPLVGQWELGGKQFRIPGRALMAEDEFFKAIGYRMELNALAARSAFKEGLKGKEFADHYHKIISKPSAEIKFAATENGRYLTFTKDLGRLGKDLQHATAKHPFLKLVMPFVRTPINIVKFGLERTPVGLAFSDTRAALRAGGVARDEALAKMVMGTGIGAAVASMAGEGAITGGGPTNQNVRSFKYMQGWQPYSVNPQRLLGVGPDRYYAFNRLEPLGMILGMAADFAEISGQIEDVEADELAMLITASIAKNISNKTFLKGLSETIEAFYDPQRYGSKWFLNYTGTVVPTAVAQYARSQDPILRRFDDVSGKIRSRLPGESEHLPPRRNVFGEIILLGGGWGPDIISPIYTSDVREDKVADAFEDAEYFPSMPQEKIEGVELTPEQYDFYVVKAGTEGKRRARILVNLPFWDRLPKEFRKKKLRQVMEQTRDEARQLTQIEFSELRDKINQKRVEDVSAFKAPSRLKLERPTSGSPP